MPFFGKKPPASSAPTSARRHMAPDFIAGNFLAMFKEAYTRPRPTGEPGIHVETLVAVLGAMAGFGCQVAVREAIVGRGKMPLRQALLEVKTKDGGTYYVGDQLTSHCWRHGRRMSGVSLPVQLRSWADRYPTLSISWSL